MPTTVKSPKEYTDLLKEDIVESAIQTFKAIRFNNSDDIHSFIYNYTGSDNFFAWFNTKIAKKDYFGAYQFFGEEKKENGKKVPKVRTAKGSIAKADEINFNNFWNAVSPKLPHMDNSGINIAQFAGLFSIVTNESSRFRPIGEYGNLEYMFRYNVHPNKKADYLFSNKDFKDAHTDLDYYDDVVADSITDIDSAWSGTTYPKKTATNTDGFPTDPSEGGIISEADFYKFRGRGLIQTTWRSAYIVVINEILKYSGQNKVILKYKKDWTDNHASDIEKIASISTNADWDDLFENTDLEIACLAIKNFKRSEHFMEIDFKNTTELLGEGKRSIRSIAKLVAGKNSLIYHRIFESRVIQILEQLLIDNTEKLNSFNV